MKTARFARLINAVVTRIVVQEHERALLYQDGRAVRWLQPGPHRFVSATVQTHAERFTFEQGVTASTPELEALVPQSEAKRVTVPQGQAGVVLIDGRPSKWLTPGQYLLWQLRATVELECIDLSRPSLNIPESYVELAPQGSTFTILLRDHERAIVMHDGQAVSWLGPGRHVLWTRGRHVEARKLDLTPGYIRWEPLLGQHMPANLGHEEVVAPQHTAVLLQDGLPSAWLGPGRYMVWDWKHQVELVRFDQQELLVDIPEAYIKKAPSGTLRKLALGTMERAILSKNGRPVHWLSTGTHVFWDNVLWSPHPHTGVTRFDLDDHFVVATPEYEAIVPEDQYQLVTVPAEHGGVLLLDDEPVKWLSPGRYMLWKTHREAKLELIDLTPPLLDIPESHARLAPSDRMRTVILTHTQRAVLTIDGQVAAWLEPGRHVIWQHQRTVDIQVLDLSTGHVAWSAHLAEAIPEGMCQELIVPPHEAAYLLLDQQPSAWLAPGRYLIWATERACEVLRFDMRQHIAQLPEVLEPLTPNTHLRAVRLAEYERGILVVDGRPRAWVEPGRHRLWCALSDVQIQRIDTRSGFHPYVAELESVLPEGATVALHVDVDEIAIVFSQRAPQACLTPGRYLLWQVREEVTAERYSLKEIHSNIPEAYHDLLPDDLLQNVTVHPYERGLLYVDGKLETILESGRYTLSQLHHQTRVVMVDMREQSIKINGQEIITADKIMLRVNLLIKYRVVDALASVQEQTSLHEALYSEAQMAARRLLASHTVDALLQHSHTAPEQMQEQVAERARDWGVEVLRLDLKDIILPGDVREMLSKVLNAEKQAEANAILRREETAANRIQLNMARQLQTNPALMRLKELEVLRDAAANIDNLTIVADANGLRPGLLPIQDQAN